MNIFKMLCLIIAFATSYICPMEEYLQLSSIEKQLIVKEVKKQGKNKILTDLYKKGKYDAPLMYDKHSDLCWFRRCTVFNVDITFYQRDVEKDPLTQDIFDIIQVSEKEKNHRPKASCDAASNVLGERTQYWWLQDAEDNCLPAIQVQFLPHCYVGDQKAIEEVVQSVVDQIEEESC